MRAVLLFLPYLLMPLLMVWLVRLSRLERWWFMFYFVCAGTLLLWPTLWMIAHRTMEPGPEDVNDGEGMFSFVCAMTLVPVALMIQWTGNKLIGGKNSG